MLLLIIGLFCVLILYGCYMSLSLWDISNQFLQLAQNLCMSWSSPLGYSAETRIWDLCSCSRIHLLTTPTDGSGRDWTECVTWREYRHPNLAPTCLELRDFNNLASCKAGNRSLRWCDTKIPRSLIRLKWLKITGASMDAKSVTDLLSVLFFQNSFFLQLHLAPAHFLSLWLRHLCCYVEGYETCSPYFIL